MTRYGLELQVRYHLQKNVSVSGGRLSPRAKLTLGH